MRLFLACAITFALLAPVVHADQPTKKSYTLAHIKLTGSLNEKAPVEADPVFGSLGGETFRMTVDRIKKASADKNVNGLLLEIDGVSVGWGKLNELSAVIAGVRKSGKKVYAYLESGESKDYLLALACDEVALPESGALMLTGVRMEVSFYKPLFEKLGIKADMIQMGDFKAAAEPYTRDSLSDANRKQLTSVVDDFFDHDIVERIVSARKNQKLTTEKVKNLIDDGPYSAKSAKQAGLVDRLTYLDDYTDAIKTQAKADSVKVLKDYGKKKDEDPDLFGLMRKLLFGGGSKSSSSTRTPKVAVIYATGAIMTGKSGSSILGGETCGSETLVKAIKQAEEDKSVKAIVLRIDSPGGSALASDLIWNELKRCKKPVIASMSDVAASGGYYIAMSSKKIYAEPGTITGSIGVIGGKLALRGLWDKVGVKSEVISRGKNSGILSSDEPFSASEKKRMTELMKDIYDQFLDKAIEGRKNAGRKMTRDDLEKLAGGRIWTGRQAKENGLIDEVGTLEDAIKEAAKLGGLPADKEPELLQLPKSRGALESMLSSLPGAQGGLKLDLSSVPQLREKFGGVDAVLGLKNERAWLIVPYRLEVK